MRNASSLPVKEVNLFLTPFYTMNDPPPPLHIELSGAKLIIHIVK